MQKRIFIVSIILLIAMGCSFYGNSQNTIDSLQTLLNTEISDYNKADLFYKLALEEYHLQNYDVSMQFAENSVSIAVNLDSQKIEADNIFLIGNIFNKKTEFENAIRYYMRAINLYEKLSNKLQIAESYSQIADCYFNLGALSKAADYYKQSYQIYKDISDKKREYEMLQNTAEAYYLDHKYNLAETYYLLLLENSYTQLKPYDLIKIYLRITETAKQQADYSKALDYNTKIYNLYVVMNDTLAMSVVLNNIGYTNLYLNDYKGALDAFKKSLKLSKKSDISNEEYAKLYSNIAICYQNLKDYDNALINIQNALKSMELSKNYTEIARLENLTANLYLKTGDLYYADLYSKNSVASASKSENKHLLAACYYTYSRVLREGNDYIMALEYYEKHLKLRDSLQFIEKVNEQELSRKVNELEKSERELKLQIADEQVKNLALKQLRLEAEKRDKELELLRSERELEQSEKDRLQQSLQIAKQQHEAELRKTELIQLEQEKAIQDLALKQKEAEEKERQKEIKLLESEKELQKLELEKQAEAKKRAQWMFALVSLIVVLIFIGLVITRRKNAILAKQKIEIEEKNSDLEQKNEEILTQSERIVQQKELIEKKNEEITDSIHYASRIQNAVLPSVDVLGNYLSEYYILFNPKDIVSGDFYWAAEKNNKLIVTAVDCTGHGVPGAFMSMLGMSFLNEIVLKEEILDADQILNHLRTEIIGSLKQSGRENEAKDGMDMALCVIDKENMKLQYAGANNPIYFIRDGVMQIIKSDRMPIGIHFKANIPFTKTEIDIKKDDVIYIFTDGFADQFGGDDGRKLKYQPFQELIKSMHHEPMNKQQKHIKKAFDDWRGFYEQIDDVLVIGVRI